jgi:hypothetical protein
MKKEPQLNRVIRRAEAGEICKGDVTIRVSINGYSVTRFCSIAKFEKTMEEMKEVKSLLKGLKKL